MKEKTKGIIISLTCVIILAIPITFAYIVLNKGEMGDRPVHSIAITCVLVSHTNNYFCVIANADSGVDFSDPKIEVFTQDNVIVSSWVSGIFYSNGIQENDSAKFPIFTGKLIDDGDNKFGVGDRIFLQPFLGNSLVGIVVKVTCKIGEGSTTIY